MNEENDEPDVTAHDCNSNTEPCKRGSKCVDPVSKELGQAVTEAVIQLVE